MNTMSKFSLMVLSFVLSLILWVYVQVQEKPLPELKSSYTLDIASKGLPDNLVVVSQQHAITIFPTGSLADRSLIQDDDLSAYVDLSRAKVGQFSYPVRIQNKGDYPGGWSPKSPMATVRIDTISSATVPVDVVPSGVPQDRDYLFVQERSYTEPRYVTITGPTSDVKDVKTGWALVDLSTVSPGLTPPPAKVFLNLSDGSPAPGSIKADPPSVLVHPDIVVSPLTRNLHVLPDFKGVPPPGYTIKSVEVTPEDVEVRGQSDAIIAVSFLRTEPIDLTGLMETKTFTAVPILPTAVILSPPAPAQPISVKVTIEPTATKTATKSPAPKPASEKRRRRHHR